jgi:hypothetical protein
VAALSLRTPDDAAAWVDRVGLALLFPKPDVVLPSLWEAVAGQTEVDWAIRAPDGGFVSFTPEMDKVWRWKDELPATRRACVGLHLVRTTGLVAPRLVPALYALTERAGTLEDFRNGLEGLERELAEAVLELGRPATRRELRLLASREKRQVDNAVNSLQRKLVLTNAGTTDREPGWSSTLHDLFARRWRARLRRVPAREEALLTLGEAVLVAAGDASAADLAAALRLRRREATAVLEALEELGAAQPQDEAGVTVWTAAPRRHGRAP